MEKTLFHDRFEHIYIENAVVDHERTKKLLAKIKYRHIIYIDHYKDIFNRHNQSVSIEKDHQSLIIAKKEGRLIYDGAPVCQSFGNEHFYYTSLMMNCIYDCKYCYLKGMYPSGHMVIFINLEDYFAEVEEILKEHPMYISISYDSDLLSLERLTGYVKKWIEFVERHKNLSIEIRTKAAPLDIWDRLIRCDRVIFAYTLTQDEVILKDEIRTPDLKSRIASLNTAIDHGFKVRLCFDPLIYVKDYEEKYKNLIGKISSMVDMDKIKDVSVGTFRISAEFLKNIRKQEKMSSVVQFPFESTDGYYHYPEVIENGLTQTVVNELKKYIGEDKIFIWKSR